MLNLTNFKEQFVLALHRKKAVVPRETKFRRCLNALELVSFGVGSIIGSGIFVLTGVAAATKAGPAVVISFAFAGILSMLNALFYAELACRVPQTGYAYTTVGEVVAWIIGWDLTLEYMIGSAAVARGWSGYFVLLFESFHVTIPEWIHHVDLGNGWDIDLLAALSVLLFTSLLCVGTRKSSLVNGILVVTKLVIILFVIVVGSIYAEARNWDNFLPFGVQGIFSRAAVVFFAFIGFDNVCTMSEECKNPTRDLPIGVIGSLTISSILYVLTAIVVTLLVPFYQVDLDAPLTSAFQEKGLQWAVIITSIGAFAGLSTAELGGLIAQPRIFFSLSEDGLLPRWFSTVHPRFKTPINSTIVCGVITAAVALFFGIEILSEMVSIGTLLAFTIVACCVVTLRHKADIPPVNNSLIRRLISYCQSKVEYVCGVIVIMSIITSLCVVYSAPIPILLVITMLISSVLFPLQHVNIPENYKCPWIPLTPILAIYGNSYLMASLSWDSWIRLAVWLIVGMLIYLSYGMHHSKLVHGNDNIINDINNNNNGELEMDEIMNDEE